MIVTSHTHNFDLVYSVILLDESELISSVRVCMEKYLQVRFYVFFFLFGNFC